MHKNAHAREHTQYIIDANLDALASGSIVGKTDSTDGETHATLRPTKYTLEHVGNGYEA